MAAPLAAQAGWREGPPLPLPLTNNSVVGTETTARGPAVFSFLGLESGKAWSDVTNRAFRWDVGSEAWTEIAPVPGPGRLASTAQAVGGRIYLFGGYVVAEDGSELSLEAVDIYHPDTDTWTSGAPIPVPVDDAVSGVWADSLIYLVSGWHDADNEPNVQVYDPAHDTWSQATEIPGVPVFGHTGGIARDFILYVDGVERREGSPRYALAPATWLGEINPFRPTLIEWRKQPDHPGVPVYRAAGVPVGTRILFLGGTDNPYNYDGVGYNGVPSRPLNQLLAFDVATGRWSQLVPPPIPTMDHRNLARAGGMVVRVGGMEADQRVTARVWYAPILELLTR